jgi:hypothetical protein
VALQRRLETDRSLAVFAGQFVPLKLVTANNEDWGQWSRKYKHEGKGIPIIYVVRPDGKQLYGKSGSLEGETLLALLMASVQDAGKILSDAEVALLQQVVAAAESAEEQVDMASALAPVLKISKTGQLQSYSELATKVNEFFNDFTTTAQTSIDEALAAVESGNPRFEDVYTLVAAQESYKQFPQFSDSLKKIRRALSRPAEIKVTALQATALYRARSLADSPAKSTRNRARAALQRISTKYPGTQVDKLAQAELAEIGPRAKPEPKRDVAKLEPFRTWTDTTGKFAQEAQLVEFAGGIATLKKRDGTEVKIPEKRLSEADRKHLEDRR